MARGPDPRIPRHRPFGETIEEAFPHILAKVNQGMPVSQACELAGFLRATLHEWMAAQTVRREELTQARAAADEKLVYGLYAKADDDPRVAQWILERKRPDEWGRAERVEVTGKDGGPIETVHKTRAEAWDDLKEAARANPEVRAALIKIIRETE